MVFRERILINSMFSMAPNIVFVPSMTQNAERKHRTQDTNTANFRSYALLISAKSKKSKSQWVQQQKYSFLNTCQVSSVRKACECNTRCAVRGVLGFQIQSLLEVTFLLLNLICSALHERVSPTLPESPLLGENSDETMTLFMY